MENGSVSVLMGVHHLWANQGDRKKYGFLRTVLGERMDNEYARVLFIFIGSA